MHSRPSPVSLRSPTSPRGGERWEPLSLRERTASRSEAGEGERPCSPDPIECHFDKGSPMFISGSGIGASPFMKYSFAALSFDIAFSASSAWSWR